MPDIDTWTPADDALVRSALDSLRAETDTLPLADPRALRARGALRRRRALRGLPARPRRWSSPPRSGMPRSAATARGRFRPP